MKKTVSLSERAVKEKENKYLQSIPKCSGKKKKSMFPGEEKVSIKL